MGDHFHRGGYPPRDFRRDGEGRYYGHQSPDHYGPSGGGYPPPHRQEIKQERDLPYDRRPVEPALPPHDTGLKNEFKQEQPDPGYKGPNAGDPPQSLPNRKRSFDDRGRGFYEHREDRRNRFSQGRGGGHDDEDDVFDESFVVLDNYNSDLHFKLSKDRTVGFPLTKQGFAYLWSGARATHGVNKGRVCYELKITEEIAVEDLPASEPDPHVVRVGWSLDSCSTQLGEEMFSYGYGGTAKKSTNSKFENYGETFAENDVIGCFIDSDPESDEPLDLESPGYRSTIDSLIEAVNQSLQVDEEPATSSTDTSVSFKKSKRTHRVFANHPKFQAIVQRHRERPDKRFQGQRSLESKYPFSPDLRKQWTESPPVDPPVSRLSSKTILYVTDGSSIKDPTDRLVDSLARSVFEASGSALFPSFAATWVAKAVAFWADSLHKTLQNSDLSPDIAELANQISLAGNYLVTLPWMQLTALHLRLPMLWLLGERYA
ncbi:unnamed protein product [Ranitomeya imitator]|uniref:SPRY domain-containing protein n=1 Tax=Ranitomeya imitator TaxID=111125 RepID=A0ABN9M4D9_9NEOB|nr:unnamed protein product [Ranitomeya imitator]